MKKKTTIKRMIAAALFLLAGVSQTFANEYEIIWAKAEAYPTGAGTVYVGFVRDDERTFAATSEFKRGTNGAVSSGFIWAQPADGWLLSGFARDNGNGIYDNGIDLQVKVRDDGQFTAIPYPDKITGNSSSEADELAQEALAQKTGPSDHLFAVFTKGVVSRVAEDQIGCGNAYADKLYSEPGDQVTLVAYGDSFSPESGGVKRFKFDHWTDADDHTVSTDREYTVTVTGTAIYYAHFVECTEEEYKATENDPHKSESYYSSDISTVKAAPSDNGAFYDLHGRRVAQPSKGIFIRNGKKVILL